MTILERLHAIGFASAAGAGGELLLKATFILAAALVLDFLLHRRMLLACSAAWNGTLVLLALLPIACLALPAKRVGSTASIATNIAYSTELPAVVTQPTSLPENRRSGILPLGKSGETPLLQPNPDATIEVPVDEVSEEPAATQISTKPPAQVAAASSVAANETVPSSAPAPASRWATLLAWATAARPWFVPGLVAAYFAGVAVLMLRMTVSLVAVSRLRRRSQAVTNNDWLEQLAVWRTRCGLRRAVELRHSGDVTVPIVIGFRRPAIIVPTDLIESAGGERRDAILAHELAHIVRGDLGWQLLERVVGAVLWFHPLAWFAGRRIGLVRERICDGFAVHHLGRRTVYVETLLEMATRLTSRRGLSLGLAVLRTSQLGTRLASVQNSTGLQRCQVRPAARWAVLVLTAAAALWAGRAAVGVEPVPQVAGLPSDAQALLAGYEQKSARLQAEVDRQVSAERDALIKSLQALQDDYTKQARLDEAVAIRDQLRLIKAPTMAVVGQALVPPGGTGNGMPGIRAPQGMPGVYPGMPRPGTPGYPPGARALYAPPVSGIEPAAVNDNPLSMTPFRKSIGKVLLVEVTGSKSGTVWGDSEVCTDDSSLAAAAVQFGVLKPGVLGMIKVTIVPGKKDYAGFSQHGVTSQPWDNANGAYASLKIESAPVGAFVVFCPNKYETPGVTILDNGKNFSLANFVGYTFIFETKGEVNGSVWGTDEYTHDSSLGAAAVHAGVLQAGQTGYVVMQVKPGIPFYRGSTRNGVTSSDWNNSGNNYVTLTFQSPSAAAQEAEDRPATADYLPSAVIQLRAASEASSELFRRSVGHAICFNVTGSSEGVIWGSNPYTDDSSLAAAAVHAGILQPGEQGMIKVDVEPARDNFQGSTQHGVTSQNWNSGGGYVALRLSRASELKVIKLIGPGGSGGSADKNFVVIDPSSMRPGSPAGTKASASQQVLPDPETMTDYAQSLGQSFSFRVTGSTGGSIWGTDVYTNDSMLAKAAVHAGALRAGETGIVKVTMLPALPRYHGSVNNGVTSQPWENDGSYVSYKVERADGLRTRVPQVRDEGAVPSDVLSKYQREIQNLGGAVPLATPSRSPSNIYDPIPSRPRPR